MLVGAYEVVEAPGLGGALDVTLEFYIRPGNRVAYATGTLQAPDWTDERRVTGEVALAPRGLSYALDFAPYRLSACLALDLRNPVFTATRVSGVVEKANRPLLRVELRWDLRHDAWAFLGSWRPERDGGILRVGGTHR
jgi:hypothetical protein